MTRLLFVLASTSVRQQTLCTCCSLCRTRVLCRKSLLRSPRYSLLQTVGDFSQQHDRLHADSMLQMQCSHSYGNKAITVCWHHHACIGTEHTQYAQVQCTNSMHRTKCIHNMHRYSAQTAYTGQMHTWYAQVQCTHNLHRAHAYTTCTGTVQSACTGVMPA